MSDEEGYVIVPILRRENVRFVSSDVRRAMYSDHDTAEAEAAALTRISHREMASSPHFTVEYTVEPHAGRKQMADLFVVVGDAHKMYDNPDTDLPTEIFTDRARAQAIADERTAQSARVNAATPGLAISYSVSDLASRLDEVIENSRLEAATYAENAPGL